MSDKPTMTDTITEQELAEWERLCEEAGEVCHRCEGNGAIYADGKAHYPSEGAQTIHCPCCGGEGRTYDIEQLTTALPRLIAELREARKRVAELESEKNDG